jgi:hypothetical protein
MKFDLIEATIDDCIRNNQYFGLGNPNAKILFIGKEAGRPIGSDSIHGSGESWRKYDYSKRFQAEGNLKHGRHTWQKYQKLYETIKYKLQIEDEFKKGNPYEITFVEEIFTTEISNLHAPTSREAKHNANFGENLKKRKDEFWKSEFIKRFPVVLIAALDNKYIETYTGEVCEIFDVEFTKLELTEKSENIWIHFATDKNALFPKLVIHTRQLTNGASNNLLDKIADIIKDFVIKNSIDLKPNTSR